MNRTHLARCAWLAVLAAGIACASDPARRQKIVQEEAARLRPPEVPLSEFGTFELLPTAMSPDVAAKPEKAEAANAVGAKLDATLKPLLASWAASAPADRKGRTLVVQPTVTGLRVISGGARFWGGALAGDSYIDLDVVLFDKESGKRIGAERIHKSASAMSGAWSVGGSDRNLPDYVVDIAQQYLVNAYKK